MDVNGTEQYERRGRRRQIRRADGYVYHIVEHRWFDRATGERVMGAKAAALTRKYLRAVPQGYHGSLNHPSYRP